MYLNKNTEIKANADKEFLKLSLKNIGTTSYGKTLEGLSGKKLDFLTKNGTD